MRALVTGGGGFLGSAIVARLVARGWQVRSFSRSAHPQLAELGVEQQQGDVDDQRAVERAVAGCDAVFHVAAKAGIWGRRGDFFAVNVTGTANVIHACRSHRVAKLVFTSTPSVVHAGGDLEGVDESTPYPERFEAWYPQTKAAAEQMVLAANGRQLATVALRPHLVWGPEDPHFAPRLVARHRSGALRLVGDGDKLVDSVYIDNAADAHLLACDRLAPGATCAGRAYFISQGQPLPMRELINRILAAAGLPPVTRSVSPAVARTAGWLLESTYRLLRVSSEPRMTRFLASQLATAHWFDISAARSDLGYEPTVSIDEGMRLQAAWFSSQQRHG